jgi:transcriptional regulator with XRE-family HTH domain
MVSVEYTTLVKTKGGYIMGVKDLRYKLGYTQEELIKIANMSESTIRKLEKDYREIYNASDDQVLKLMTVFDCTIQELLSPDVQKYKRIDTYNRKKLI